MHGAQTTQKNCFSFFRCVKKWKITILIFFLNERFQHILLNRHRTHWKLANSFYHIFHHNWNSFCFAFDNLSRFECCVWTRGWKKEREHVFLENWISLKIPHRMSLWKWKGTVFGNEHHIEKQMSYVLTALFWKNSRWLKMIC